VPGVADVMIAGNRAKADAETPHQFGRMAQVVLDIGAVDCNVARMDDEVGPLCCDPYRERRPIVGKMPLAGAQMGI
jgi:hypothetical protein